MCAEPSLSKTRSSFKGCVFAPIPCHKEQHHGSHGRQVLLCIQIRRKSLCTRDLDARLPPETTFCTGAPSPVESSHAHCPRYCSHHFPRPGCWALCVPSSQAERSKPAGKFRQCHCCQTQPELSSQNCTPCPTHCNGQDAAFKVLHLPCSY